MFDAGALTLSGQAHLLRLTVDHRKSTRFLARRSDPAGVVDTPGGFAGRLMFDGIPGLFFGGINTFDYADVGYNSFVLADVLPLQLP